MRYGRFFDDWITRRHDVNDTLNSVGGFYSAYVLLCVLDADGGGLFSIKEAA